MSILSSIAKWFARRKSVGQPVTFAQAIGMGNVIVPAVGEQNYHEAYSINPWVQACVRAIARAVASVPWVVQVRDRDGWTEAGQDHPLSALLDYVNNAQDWYQLAEATAAHLALMGNAYWLLLRPNDRRPPQAIQVLPPHRVGVVRGQGRRNQFVAGYNIDLGNNQRRQVSDTDVVHFRTFSPTDQYYGESPVRALENAINTYTYLEAFNREFFRRAGIPAGILRSESRLTEDELKRLREQFAQWHGDVTQAGRTVILGNDLEYQTVGLSPDQVAAIELPARIRETICAVFGVPPAVVGIYEYANYANAELQRKLFWADTVLPLLRLIEAGVNEQLAPQFGEGLRFAFDTSGIEALQPDRRLLAQTEANLVRAGIHTPNDARRALGDEPSPDSAADELYMPMSMVSVASVGGQQSRTASPVGHRKSVRRVSEAVRVAIYKRHNERRDRTAGRIERDVAGWFERLGEQMVQRIRGQKSLAVPARVREPRLELLVFNLDEATDALAALLLPQIEEMLAEHGQQAIADMGAQISFDIDNPRVRQILEGRRIEMRSIARRHWQRIRESLSEGLANGETVDQLTERVMEWVKRGKQQYAPAVARTETGIAMNMGALEGYRQAGATHKEWLAIVDDRTRDSHAELDGTVIPIGEMFDVNGHGATGPGDPSLPAEEIINCRCTIAPAFQE